MVPAATEERARDGLREHTDAGWNIGKVPYGYLAEKIPHPSPSKAAQGLTKTRLILDPGRAPVIEQIYAWRTDGKMAVNSIVSRLNATGPPTRPPIPGAAGPEAGSARRSETPNTPGIRCGAAPSTAGPSPGPAPISPPEIRC